MNDINNKVTVIIRSVGERTEQLCRELILAQGVAPANVVIVREAPFSAAMHKSFEIGIKRDLPWTLCVDADLLLRPGSVEKILQLADEQEENVCQIQGYILDKFFGGPRQGGVHLYRTSLLPLALTRIPPEGKDIRPETHTLNRMVESGYPWITVPYLVGLHDFEQYYRDIFRKCFVQAHKHQYLADLFLSIWRSGAQEDKDYQVALQGFAAGIAYYEKINIDIRQEIYQTQFSALQVMEKRKMLCSNYTLNEVEQMIAQWNEPEIYQSKFPTKAGLTDIKDNQLTSRKRFIHHMNKLGPIKIIPYATGWALLQLGNRLQILASFDQKDHISKHV